MKYFINLRNTRGKRRTAVGRVAGLAKVSLVELVMTG